MLTTLIFFSMNLKGTITHVFFFAESKHCSDGPKKGNANIIIGVAVGVGALCLILFIVALFWWTSLFRRKSSLFRGKSRRESGKYCYFILNP